MIEQEKYRKLVERFNEENPEGGLEEQAEFYFRHLTHLEIDLLVAEI